MLILHQYHLSPYNEKVQRMVEHENAFLRWLPPKVVPGGIVKITSTQGIGRKATGKRATSRQLKRFKHEQSIDHWCNRFYW